MADYYHFQTEDIDAYFNKDLSDKDKYIVCSCARNENDYIEEWVSHYINLGFDKIIICDNNDDDSLSNVLTEYIQNGQVEIFDCHGFGSFQVQFYSMFCTEGNYKWCAYFDCDEFLELPAYNSIKEYLSDKEHEKVISFNWLTFGSNGKTTKEDGPVQERFKCPVSPAALFNENSFVKSIVKGGDTFSNGCSFNGSHLPMVEGMYERNIGGYAYNYSNSHQVTPVRYKDGYIKHYYTKSFDEWMAKAGRGWPDGTENLLYKNYFICEGWAQPDPTRLREGLFLRVNADTYEENFRDLLERYDVIHVTNPNEHIYALMTQTFGMMSMTTGHTFMFDNAHIDDVSYAMLLEMAYRTGNRAVWINNPDMAWNVFTKYNDGRNNTYYILSLY